MSSKIAQVLGRTARNLFYSYRPGNYLFRQYPQGSPWLDIGRKLVRVLRRHGLLSRQGDALGCVWETDTRGAVRCRICNRPAPRRWRGSVNPCPSKVAACLELDPTRRQP